eukprot:GHVN01045259.1.p1 GENE.GHVN01045259.1~~GHVN01045259.1.p1  ORF type:complete len:658 (+),score=143.00 GHVN01045259.1:163-2136(+)
MKEASSNESETRKRKWLKRKRKAWRYFETPNTEKGEVYFDPEGGNTEGGSGEGQCQAVVHRPPSPVVSPSVRPMDTSHRSFPPCSNASSPVSVYHHRTLTPHHSPLDIPLHNETEVDILSSPPFTSPQILSPHLTSTPTRSPSLSSGSATARSPPESPIFSSSSRYVKPLLMCDSDGDVHEIHTLSESELSDLLDELTSPPKKSCGRRCYSAPRIRNHSAHTSHAQPFTSYGKVEVGVDAPLHGEPSTPSTTTSSNGAPASPKLAYTSNSPHEEVEVGTHRPASPWSRPLYHYNAPLTVSVSLPNRSIPVPSPPAAVVVDLHQLAVRKYGHKKVGGYITPEVGGFQNAGKQAVQSLKEQIKNNIGSCEEGQRENNNQGKVNHPRRTTPGQGRCLLSVVVRDMERRLAKTGRLALDSTYKHKAVMGGVGSENHYDMNDNFISESTGDEQSLSDSSDYSTSPPHSPSQSPFSPPWMPTIYKNLSLAHLYVDVDSDDIHSPQKPLSLNEVKVKRDGWRITSTNMHPMLSKWFEEDVSVVIDELDEGEGGEGVAQRDELERMMDDALQRLFINTVQLGQSALNAVVGHDCKHLRDGILSIAASLEPRFTEFWYPLFSVTTGQNRLSHTRTRRLSEESEVIEVSRNSVGGGLHGKQSPKERQ